MKKGAGFSRLAVIEDWDLQLEGWSEGPPECLFAVFNFNFPFELRATLKIGKQ